MLFCRHRQEIAWTNLLLVVYRKRVANSGLVANT